MSREILHLDWSVQVRVFKWGEILWMGCAYLGFYWNMLTDCVLWSRTSCSTVTNMIARKYQQMGICDHQRVPALGGSLIIWIIYWNCLHETVCCTPKREDSFTITTMKSAKKLRLLNKLWKRHSPPPTATAKLSRHVTAQKSVIFSVPNNSPSKQDFRRAQSITQVAKGESLTVIVFEGDKKRDTEIPELTPFHSHISFA